MCNNRKETKMKKEKTGHTNIEEEAEELTGPSIHDFFLFCLTI
jgi:hypothetical protein